MVKTKQKLKYIFILLTSLMFILSISLISADTLSIYDQAKILTNEQRLELENKAKEVSSKYNIDVVIVTTDNADSKSSQVYADDFYEDNNLGKNNSRDGILLLIDLDNSEVYILTSGKALKYFSDQRLDNIVDQILENGLRDRDYYQASKTFLKNASDYLSKGVVSKPPTVPKVKGLKSLTPVNGIVSLVSGSLASVLFYFKSKSKYKMAKPQKYNNFRKNSQVNFINKEDRFIKSETFQKTIENTENTQTTTHTSSSGKVYGGKGSKF